MPVNTLIQIRKGTDSEWTSTNPVLGSGEPGFITDQFRLKIGDGTTDWQNLNYIGSNESLYQVRNETGSVLYAGQGVYASGIHANKVISPNLYISNGIIPDHMFMGLVTNNISNNNFGYVTHFGQINGLNTTGSASNISAGGETWTNGTLLYASASSAGKLTSVKPTEAVLVAIVLYAHATQGKLFIRPTTEPHLDDLHDVSVSGSTNGQFLQYNSGSGLWLASSSGNFTNLQLNGTTVSVSGHTHNSSDISNFNSSVSGLLPTIANSGDNRVLTSTGSSVGINAENNLTFDGNLLNVIGSGIFSSGIKVGNSSTSSYIYGSSGNAHIQFNNAAGNNIYLNSNVYTGSAVHINTQGTYLNSQENYVTGGTLHILKTGTAISTATQSPSNNFRLYSSVWNGSSAEDAYQLIRSIASTSINRQTRLGFAINNGDGTLNTTERLSITSSGFVGINNTSPSVQLHVGGSGTFTGDITASSIIASSGTAANPSFEFLNDIDTGLFSPAANTVSVATSGVERFRINESGNVGIGTVSPGSRLDVNGNVNIDGNLTFDSFTESVVAIGNSSTSKTIDLTAGTVQTCTLTANCVFTMPTATAGKSFTLFLSTGAGSFTGTFTGVRWAGGTPPNITLTASKVDILSFISDGSFWYGSYSQNYG